MPSGLFRNYTRKQEDRKSTRLNSSHLGISYAVFCLKKKIITQVKENTYYAELHIYRGDAVIQIDARPSESIAVALQPKAPIFTSETLLALTTVAPCAPRRPRMF